MREKIRLGFVGLELSRVRCSGTFVTHTLRGSDRATANFAAARRITGRYVLRKHEDARRSEVKQIIRSRGRERRRLIIVRIRATGCNLRETKIEKGEGREARVYRCEQQKSYKVIRNNTGFPRIFIISRKWQIVKTLKREMLFSVILTLKLPKKSKWRIRNVLFIQITYNSAILYF